MSVRLVLAGIPRAIAQRLLLLIAASAIATLALTAPALASAPAPLGAVSTTAASATQTVTQTVQGVGGAATQAVPPVQPSTQAAADAVQPVRRVADSAVETATRGHVGKAVGDAGSAVSKSSEALPADPRPAATEAVTQTTRTVAGASGSVKPPKVGDGRTEPLTVAVGGAVDGALRSIGDTLRGVIPVDSLTAPVAALLTDAGLLDFADVAEPLRFGFDRPVVGSAPSAGVLGSTAAEPPQLVAPTSLGAPPAGLRISQDASAQPPAAEAGGRPAGPPSPWKAPAPTAGGAAAASSGGLTFVPFLGLLVLAALVVPKLMRRLDAAPALLRPALFASALERPG